MNNTISWQIQSKAISILRLPLAALVVAIHTPFLYNTPELVFGQAFGTSLFICVVYVICQVAVPAFFMFSGYFFFSKYETNQDWVNKIKNRVKTLLIPYIVWNILAFIYLVVTDAFVDGNGFNPIGLLSERGWLRIFWDCNLVGESQVKGILGYVMHRGGPADGPLWFIRDLMILMLIAPVIKFIIDKGREYALILFGILMILDIWFPFDIFTSTAFFFFMLGGYFQRNNKLMVTYNRSLSLFVYTVTIVSLIIMMYSFHRYELVYNVTHQVFCLFGSFSFLLMACGLVNKGRVVVPKYDMSFFMFAFHTVGPILVSHHILKILFTHSHNLEEGGALMWMLTVVLAIIIIAFTYMALRKVAPKLLAILSGNRD